MDQVPGRDYIPDASNNQADTQQVPEPQHDPKRTQDSQDYANLVSLMYKKCPQEVVDHIQHWLFEIFFCPGRLFISRYPENEACGWPKVSPNRPITSPGRPTLLSLSRDVFPKYQQRLWEENTSIIASLWEFRFVPQKARKHIHKIQTAFSIRDLAFGGTRSPQPISHDNLPPIAFNQILPTPLIPRLHTRCWNLTAETNVSLDHVWHSIGAKCAGPCHQCSTMELLAHWGEKITIIGYYFDVKEWKYDFTECYGPNGDWLGDVVANDLGIYYSETRLSDKFEIIAPNAEKKQQLLARISQPMGKYPRAD
ncbi:MAG: hypothetical protein L6R42_005960 [Xanthoria sp. 1 TBL-2021]|nr:MAG: hypothetical protein L6R42_005960 [Xanthoria sp. 1 TBL-2021]